MSAQPQLRAVPPVSSSPASATEKGARVVTLDLDDAARVQEALSQFRAECLVSGVDYGIIPSTPRATLYKPGAEKLMLFFGLSLEVEMLSRTEDWDKNFVAYEIKAILRAKRSGEIEAEGIGNCNSNERKYKSQGGANCANTVLKMAKKRAFLDAVLTATRSSGLFMSEDGDDADERPRAQRSQTQKSQKPLQNGGVALSVEQWNRTEKARRRAIELGFQSSPGKVPCALPKNTPVKIGWPKCQEWEAFIARTKAIELSEDLGEETAAQSIEDSQTEAADDDTPRYKIPDQARSKVCDCGVTIFFAPTKKGGVMPCNADGTPHFITCPNAGTHRKPRATGALAPTARKPHLARIWATIDEMGLPAHSASGPGRKARLDALNLFFRDHNVPPVASFNDIAPAQTPLIVQGLRSGALTWN